MVAVIKEVKSTTRDSILTRNSYIVVKEWNLNSIPTAKIVYPSGSSLAMLISWMKLDASLATIEWMG
jgi:hypothetical protein